jgi:hypothetical protein
VALTWATGPQAYAPGDAAIQAFSDPGGVIMTLAYAMLNAKVWTRASGDTSLLDAGAAYLAAHLFTVGNKTGGSGGPTESEKVGDVERVLNVLQKDPVWDATPYGKVFQGLIRMAIPIDARIIVAGGAGPNLSSPYTWGMPYIP